MDALLTVQELAELRRALGRSRREWERRLIELKAVPANSENFLLSRAQARCVREALVSTKAALGRMNAGTYGRCVYCSAVIPPARLALMPATAACLACQRTERRAGSADR